MQFKDAFKAIIKARGYSQTGFGEKVGVKQSSVGSLIAKNNPSLDVMIRYMSEAGYDVALVPTGSNLPDGSYVLEPSKEPK